MGEEKYPPIADYGFIGDCHSVALVFPAGPSTGAACRESILEAASAGGIVETGRLGHLNLHPAANQPLQCLSQID